MRDTFVYETLGREFVAPLKSTRVPGRYVIPSGQLCREYNRWRAENGLTDQVSNKKLTMRMVSHGVTHQATSTMRSTSTMVRCAALTRDFGVAE